MLQICHRFVANHRVSVLCLFYRFSVDPGLELCVLTPRTRAKLMVICSLQPHFSMERNRWYLKVIGARQMVSTQRCRIKKVLSQHVVLANRYSSWAKNEIRLLLLSEWISFLHKSFNPIKKRKRAILCPLPSPPLPSSWVSSLSHHFLPHWWANYKKFHSLEVRFGTRESAVPENDLSVGWLWDFCPNLLPLWRKDCLFLLFSATILGWMPLSHTDLFIFRELIFPTVWKIPTAIHTVWKSIQVQHSLRNLQIPNNTASRFTCSSLNVRHASSRKLFISCSFYRSPRAGSSDSEIEQHSWWRVTVEILYSQTLCSSGDRASW